MDPGEKNRKLKEQIAALRSGNRSAILETLKALRSDGDTSVLPELYKLMLIQEDEEVLGEIAALLNDLKDKEAADSLAEAIANLEYRKIQAPLVAACWQNGLSYGKHIATFVEVVISGSYEAAVEAFTVIEEAVGELEQEERTALVSSLKSKLRQVEEQKKPLFAELVRSIESY